jgi:mono/diheme cytochrome c family protein
MEQTHFYVIGGVLVVLALAISAIGMRKPNFPSKRGLGIVAGVMVLVVAATATAAVIAARDEQQTRLEEQNEEAALEAEATGDTFEEGQASEGTAETAETEPAAPADEITLGEQVFASAGCGACHTLAAAQSTAQIGPNLDETLIAKDPAYIREAIVDPNAVIADGFGPDTMPGTYGSQFSEEEITALVAFISESTSAGS